MGRRKGELLGTPAEANRAQCARLSAKRKRFLKRRGPSCPTNVVNAPLNVVWSLLTDPDD
jgi:hypothetical protein